ncbi:MAG: DUF342 domain-containing protein [Synergistaceae bacterium]|nr:DUF342 domain-containing protein [Synergistaceae bacterium]
MKAANIERLIKETEKFLSRLENMEPKPLEDRNASWEIRVSGDLLTACLELYPAAGGGAPPDPLRIIEELDSKGIKNYSRDRVKRLATLCEAGTPVYGADSIVARGVPPRPPVQGRVEFLVPMERARRPADDDEPIDWRAIWITPSVHEGDVIARVYPPEEGEDGVDVYGEPIHAASYDFFRVAYGEGVTVAESDDGVCEVVSARTVGQPFYRDGIIDVAPLMVIEGDVDMSIGNVDFAGSVLVKGSVTEGLSVRAEGDVAVNGKLHGATVRAGGTCVLKGGVTGEDSTVAAGEDVRVGLVEHSSIKARGDIEVMGYSLFGDLEAGGAIYVHGQRRRGAVGGRCVAGGVVDVLSAGSSMGARALLESGNDPFKAEKIRKLEDRKAECGAQLEKLDAAILSLKGSGRAFGLDSMSDEEKSRLFILARFHSVLEKEAEEAIARIEAEKRAMLAERRNLGRVRVRERVHPNVVVVLCGRSMEIDRQEAHVSYYIDRASGRIERGAY